MTTDSGKEEFWFSLCASERERERRLYKKKLEEHIKKARPRIRKELEAISTQALMDMRYQLLPYMGDDFDEADHDIRQELIFEILGTRPNIMNKKESKAHRQKKKMMGRHRGRRDR